MITTTTTSTKLWLPVSVLSLKFWLAFHLLAATRLKCDDWCHSGLARSSCLQCIYPLSLYFTFIHFSCLKTRSHVFQASLELVILLLLSLKTLTSISHHI